MTVAVLELVPSLALTVIVTVWLSVVEFEAVTVTLWPSACEEPVPKYAYAEPDVIVQVYVIEGEPVEDAAAERVVVPVAERANSVSETEMPVTSSATGVEPVPLIVIVWTAVFEFLPSLAVTLTVTLWFSVVELQAVSVTLWPCALVVQEVPK